MAGLAVRAAAAVVRGPQPSVKCHVVASPKLPRYQKLRWTRSNLYSIDLSHLACFSGFAELAEFHNREELYRCKKWRQYRNICRKLLPLNQLRRYYERWPDFPQPTKSRRPPH